MYATTISCSVALVGIIMVLVFTRKNLGGMLKDDSIVLTVVSQRPYSLSRTLLFYWTIIIVVSVCFIGIADDNLTTIGSGVLILMGIVGGTATAGKVIDSNDISGQQAAAPGPPLIRIQDTPTEGFLTDILSDGNGISISRFQTVAFNLIYGCSFLSFVITQHVLYSFPSSTLTLLGISSGAYALLKIPENKP